MSGFDTVIFWISGLLQLTVAGYALRLNRLFGMAHVGWSLFCAFLLLALLHTVQSATEAQPAGQFTLLVEVMYALISLLLLLGLVHVEGVLRERQRLTQQEHRMRVELEVEVKKKTAYLTRAIEELQAEMDERKRMEVEADTAFLTLNAVSSQAELGRIATDVLANIGELTRSVGSAVNVVSDHVQQSKVADLVHVGALIREHSANLDAFISGNPNGQKLAIYIAQLAEHLAKEQNGLVAELESLKANLKKIGVLQQDYARLAGMKTFGKSNDTGWHPFSTVAIEHGQKSGILL
ncbi:MAG TPA: hypothetical protein VF988_04680 [Verrucomicrobiae bacterium]